MRNIINQITTQLTRDEGKRNIIYFDLEGISNYWNWSQFKRSYF